MYNKHMEYVNKHLYNYSDIDSLDVKRLFPSYALYCWDTESCYISYSYSNENIKKICYIKENDKLVRKNTLDVVEHDIQCYGVLVKDVKNDTYKIIPELDLNENYNFIGYPEPEKILRKDKKILNPNFNFEVHVYAWALSNTINDNVLYSTNLADFTKAIDKIVISSLPKTLPKKKCDREEYTKLKCFVHNLAWDVEFLKYDLFNKGYSYHRSNVSEITGKKTKSTMPAKSFSITENDNIVYACSIANDTIKYKSYKITSEIQLIDSYKIMASSLDNIAKSVIKVDDMFKKMGEDYDYEAIRLKGHTLTDLEKRYLYNDVYILKEFLRQFYIPLGTEQMTASSISFEQFITRTFHGENYKECYDAFEMKYPDLSENIMIYDIIRSSYKGGWTQANRKYLGVEQLLYKAVSIDINSSYPAVVRYKPLPYGKPKLIRDKNYNYKDTDYNMGLITICFDGFKNKQSDNLIGEIQVGSLNVEEFRKHGLNYKGTEYIHTNLVNGKLIGTNNKCHKYRYKMSFWDFELENMLKNMDFLIEDKVYDDILDCYFETGNIKVGYEVESILCFKSDTGFFGEAVDYFTEMKIKGKNENNPTMTAFAKIVLNSFYGKMASRYEREERYLYFDENGLAHFESDGLCYDSDRRYYPAFASAVTAWARVNLRTNLYNVGYNNVLYFDTDSLYTTITESELRKKVHNLHPTTLGCWDIEKEYCKFKSIGAKKYMVHGKSHGKNEDYKDMCKCAGLPADVRETITFPEFVLGNTFTGKKVKTRTVGGYTLIEGDYKLNDYSRF